MIKNIVFDIGNVLVSFGWKDFLKRFHYNEAEYQRVVKATVGSATWDEVDRGVLTDEECLEGFIQNDPEYEVPIRRMFANIAGILHQFDYTKSWIQSLQERGYRVYCLSNMSYKACRECAEALDFLPMLDGYILSCEVKLIKPDPAIYHTLLSKYQLKAEECVFLDDLEANVNAARDIGMKGIIFKGQEQAIQELELLG